MSDLQVVLIVLGGFIIAGVVIYNWEQERKLRNEVAGEFIVPQKDVLADDFHIDADAYMIDKELAEVTEKAKYFEHSAPTVKTSKTTLIAPLASETAPPNVETQALDTPQAASQPLTELVDAEHATQKEIQKKIEAELNHELQTDVQPEPIVQASLYEKTRHMQVNLPEITHSQVDLTAILYLTNAISSNELSAFISSIAGIRLPMTLHGLDNQDKWHLVRAHAQRTQRRGQARRSLARLRPGVAATAVHHRRQVAEDLGTALDKTHR